MDFMYKLFTDNKIKPTGWLRRQLVTEAEGLVGNLDRIWGDIADSAWIGGECEGWERVPYWLDGYIPLAYMLEDPVMLREVERDAVTRTDGSVLVRRISVGTTTSGHTSSCVKSLLCTLISQVTERWRIPRPHSTMRCIFSMTS